ncbi:MAG: ORF6N domain-containing protein [Halobacteriovoraceae bacterium]|nr:ORF6N domain-containing protein [Halobacteriovoraceae bacterium]
MDKETIETMIYQIRGQRVMLDADLAKLYGVETKVLKQAVKRNKDRFPPDFMFVPNFNELELLRSQIVTLKSVNPRNHVFRHKPYLFTESGVGMISSVLNGMKAIQVNIAIIRTFIKLRSYLAFENSVEHKTQQTFKIVFARLDNLEENITPLLPPHRKKIGLKLEDS